MDGATLLPRNPLAGDCFVADAHASSANAVRVPEVLTREQVTAANVRSASSRVLLRIRERDERAKYERAWRCLVGNTVKPFDLDLSDIEGEGTEREQMESLLDYIRAHEDVARATLRKINRCPIAQARWKKANRGGGRLLRALRERDEAVQQEINRRTGANELLPPRVDAAALPDGNNAMNGHVVASTAAADHSALQNKADNFAQNVDDAGLYPASFADDVARIDREMEAEEAGVKKPSKNDRLLAARTAAFERGDMAIVQSLDAVKARRQGAKRRARSCKKQRKAEPNAYIDDKYNRDPNSDDDHS